MAKKKTKLKKSPTNELDKSKILNAIARRVKDVVTAAKGMTVRNKDERAVVLGHLENLNRGLKEMESTRIFFVKPIKAAAKNIDTWFKDKTAPMKEADQILRLTVNDFDDAEEAKIVAAQEEQAEEHAAVNQDAKDLGAAPVEAPAAIADHSTKTEGSSSSSNKVLEITIDDLKKVPVEFLTLNESAVKKAFKAGTTDISGLTLKLKNSLAVRG